jgi:hypothetical protein
LINNRQNGRRRGRGNNGNGQRSGSPGGRPDSGNRIDSRARGNANQLYEKYKNLARDAQMSGDRVNTEYYLQFADHYFRVLNESRLRFQEQNPNQPAPRRIQPVDSFDDFDGDEDYGDEGEPIRAGEQDGARGGDRHEARGDGRNEGRSDTRGDGRYERGGQDGGQRGNAQRDGGQRDGGYRQQGQRDGQPRQDGRGFDEGRARNGRDRTRENGSDEGQFEQNGGEQDRGDRNVGEQAGGDQARGEQDRIQQVRLKQDRVDRFAVTGSPIANDLGEDSPDGAEPSPVEPRRRGRPRRVAAEATAAVAPAAADTPEAPAAFDADRLPPSLSIAGDPAVAEGAAEEAPRPRRRRVRTAGEAPSLG